MNARPLEFALAQRRFAGGAYIGFHVCAFLQMLGAYIKGDLWATGELFIIHNSEFIISFPPVLRFP